MKPIIDPRKGDFEDDASSTKRRSLISLAGSLLVEISLPKLALAWLLMLVLPSLLLGVAPIAVSAWVSMVKEKAYYSLTDFWPACSSWPSSHSDGLAAERSSDSPKVVSGP